VEHASNCNGGLGHTADLCKVCALVAHQQTEAEAILVAETWLWSLNFLTHPIGPLLISFCF
jgi:hypothetical protein